VIELMIVWTVLWLVAASSVALAVRGARRRSRIRAEQVLDELAAAACEALARDDRSRRAARAVERYESYRERVGAARTCYELEALVTSHRMNQGVWELAARGAESMLALLPGGKRARR
jgi:hypothetical protein